MDTASIPAAARRLAAAWTAQTWIDALPPAERPATLDDAYAIQDRLQQERGEPIAGWKIAGGSVNGLRASPSGRAAFSFMPRSCVHASGVVLPMPPGGVTLEVEIGVRFGRQAEPASAPFDPALIDEAFVTIEVIRSRFHDRKAVGQPSFIADAAAFHALVRGEALPGGLAASAPAEGGALTHDGAAIGRALVGDDGTDPLASLRLFWEHAAARRIVVPAGAVVTTGTQIAPVDVHAGGTFEGRVGAGTVRLTLR